MTALMLAGPTPDIHHLLPTLDAAADAAREAHEATRALSDTVLACQHLPAEVYQYASHLSQATDILIVASRALTAATRCAVANPSPETLDAARRATAELTGATAALRYQIAALATAASWYATPAALAPTTPGPNVESPS